MGKKQTRPNERKGGDYYFRVAVCAAVLMAPIVAYEQLLFPMGVLGFWPKLGWVGALSFGVGLLNQAARLLGRYLGKWGTILPVSVGTLLVCLAYLFA